MGMIEEILKLSPLFATLTQEEKNDLVQKLLSTFGSISGDKKEEENPLNS